MQKAVTRGEVFVDGCTRQGRLDREWCGGFGVGVDTFFFFWMDVAQVGL